MTEATEHTTIQWAGQSFQVSVRGEKFHDLLTEDRSDLERRKALAETQAERQEIEGRIARITPGLQLYENDAKSASALLILARSRRIDTLENLSPPRSAFYAHVQSWFLNYFTEVWPWHDLSFKEWPWRTPSAEHRNSRQNVIARLTKEHFADLNIGEVLKTHSMPLSIRGTRDGSGKVWEVDWEVMRRITFTQYQAQVCAGVEEAAQILTQHFGPRIDQLTASAPIELAEVVCLRILGGHRAESRRHRKKASSEVGEGFGGCLRSMFHFFMAVGLYAVAFDRPNNFSKTLIEGLSVDQDDSLVWPGPALIKKLGENRTWSLEGEVAGALVEAAQQRPKPSEEVVQAAEQSWNTTVDALLTDSDPADVILRWFVA